MRYYITYKHKVFGTYWTHTSYSVGEHNAALAYLHSEGHTDFNEWTD